MSFLSGLRERKEEGGLCGGISPDTEEERQDIDTGKASSERFPSEQGKSGNCGHPLKDWEINNRDL